MISSYEGKLRKLAERKGSGKIIMPGKFSAGEVAQSWPDFDCAVHVPMSENCGGVVESLLCGVPTIAGEVGGLPEVVHTALTGELVPIRRPEVLAYAIMNVIDRREVYKQLADRGRQLVSVMFDPRRCGEEILQIYRHILYGEPRPEEFDPRAFLRSTPEDHYEAAPAVREMAAQYSA